MRKLRRCIETPKSKLRFLTPDRGLNALVGRVAPGAVVPNADALVGHRRRRIQRSRRRSSRVLLARVVRVVAQRRGQWRVCTLAQGRSGGLLQTLRGARPDGRDTRPVGLVGSWNGRRASRRRVGGPARLLRVEQAKGRILIGGRGRVAVSTGLLGSTWDILVSSRGHLDGSFARGVLRLHAEGVKRQWRRPAGGARRLHSHVLARGGVVIVQARVLAVQCTVLARNELATLVFIHGIGAHGAVGFGARNICITLVNLLSFLYCCPDSESLLLWYCCSWW
jgi:hypothetical protein